jgi:hypothetical protein
MLEWNPSYDFRLFDIGWASPLQANEYGAATSFRANDPTSFVDFSLNQLAGLLNPRSAYPYPQRQLPMPIEEVPFLSFFQNQAAQSSSETRERLKRVRDEADRLLGQAGGGEPCAEGRNILGGCGPILGSKKVTKHDGSDSSVGTATPTGGRIGDATKAWFESLPAGSGIFLIGVAVVILLLLFIRK